MKIVITFCTVILTTSVVTAQNPAPMVVVQAATAPAATAAPQVQSTAPASSGATLKAIQEMKATNEEILKKQAATLQQLDELQKAADQLRIYSKRG